MDPSFACWSHSLSHLSSGIMHSRFSLFLHSKEIWFNFWFFSKHEIRCAKCLQTTTNVVMLVYRCHKAEEHKEHIFLASLVNYHFIIKYMKDKESSSKIKGQRFIICFCHFVFRVTCQEMVHIFWESLTCVSSVITFSLLIGRFIFSRNEKP